FCNQTALNILFRSYVLSRLENASLIWSPIYSFYIDSIENVQRRFVKYLWFKLDGVYSPRGFPNTVLLKRFDMIPLAYRRAVLILIFLHKLINYKIDAEELLYRVRFRVARIASRNA